MKTYICFFVFCAAAGIYSHELCHVQKCTAHREHVDILTTVKGSTLGKLNSTMSNFNTQKRLLYNNLNTSFQSPNNHRFKKLQDVVQDDREDLQENTQNNSLSPQYNHFCWKTLLNSEMNFYIGAALISVFFLLCWRHSTNTKKC